MTKDMRRFFQKFAIGFAVMIVTLIVMVLLPHRVDLRWQAVRVEAFARLGWIYQRIHDDQTPIDIAFIGTSHTMMGIDTPLFQQKIAVAGLRTAGDHCAQVVNFAIPSYGRDLHWLIARELLENRPVKVLVVEVFENETRKAHPLFMRVAGVEDILRAPMLINLGYLNNLIHLPYRQLSLAIESLMPDLFGLKDHFDPADYDGSDVDNTQFINVDGAALSPLRNKVMNSDELEAAAQKNRNNKNPHMLPQWAEPYEYIVPNHYLTALLDLAREHGTRVVFLYLPQYGMPDRPVDNRFYEGRGDWLYANELLHHQEYWFDESHLNAQGALALTPKIASDFVQVSKTYTESFVFPHKPVACTAVGYPPRTTLRPFKSGHQNID